MEKNKIGQPFQSVYHFPVFSKTVKNRVHVRSGDKVDIRDNIINMYTWGIKTNLDYDFYLGRQGALICLLSQEYDSVDDLIAQNPQIKEIADAGYELAIGEGFSVYPNGKVKPKQSRDEKPTNKALYCTNYRKFLPRKEQSGTVVMLENMMREVGGLPPLPEDRRVGDFSKYAELDSAPEEVTRKKGK